MEWNSQFEIEQQRSMYELRLCISIKDDCQIVNSFLILERCDDSDLGFDPTVQKVRVSVSKRETLFSVETQICPAL